MSTPNAPKAKPNGKPSGKGRGPRSAPGSVEDSTVRMRQATPEERQPGAKFEVGKATEPMEGGSDVAAKIAEYQALEDAIEDAASVELWRLADWLAAHVPSAQGARHDIAPRGVKLTLAMLAGVRDRSASWLRRMRKVAEVTAPNRLNVTIRAYEAALRATGWDLAAANERLRGLGGRVRDQSESNRLASGTTATARGTGRSQPSGSPIEDDEPRKLLLHHLSRDDWQPDSRQFEQTLKALDAAKYWLRDLVQAVLAMERGERSVEEVANLARRFEPYMDEKADENQKALAA